MLETGRVDGAIAARKDRPASSISAGPQPEKGSFGRRVAPSPPLPQAAPPRAAAERGRGAVFSMAVDWLGFGYAALVASGGIIGYAKAGSVPSLAAGLFFGSLAGLGAYQLSQNPNNIWISLITSGTLTAVMGTRFYNSGKFMPAGLIAGVSLLMVGRLALKMVEKPHDK
ncbi:transmembrane protein 14C-like [Chroicocephalus ridibundus]|uniref:transmembrane protein 14C-like n=1 Tax=Chroicocephalus ridibundus TaxID=1192867 RepID=UPI002FDD23F0